MHSRAGTFMVTLAKQKGGDEMAIRAKGGSAEYVFTKFLGEGRVDAMNLETGEQFHNVPVKQFKADGGMNEIIREIKTLQETFNRLPNSTKEEKSLPTHFSRLGRKPTTRRKS